MVERHFVGARLHKTLAELDAMPVLEFVSWLAYFIESERPRK